MILRASFRIWSVVSLPMVYAYRVRGNSSRGGKAADGTQGQSGWGRRTRHSASQSASERLAGGGGLSYDGPMPLVIDEAELQQLPVSADPDVMSGALVFRGTRVPVDALIENLEAGLTLDEFLDNFPTVSRFQAVDVLEHWRRTLKRLAKAS